MQDIQQPARIDDLAPHAQSIGNAVARNQDDGGLSQIKKIATPALQAVRVMKKALPHTYIRQPGEHLAQHVAVGIIVFGQTALPVGFEHDKPRHPGLRA